MKKIYYSPSGNRRVWVEIGKISFVKNGITVMEPEMAKCQFGSTVPGRFETEDERVQIALEKHPSFNRDFILFEGKAAELLANAKTLREIVPNAKEMAERDQLVKEAQTLGIRIDLIKATNAELKAAVERHRVEMLAKTEMLVTPAEVPEAPQIKEAPVAKEMPQTDKTLALQYTDRLATRRSKSRPKPEVGV